MDEKKVLTLEPGFPRQPGPARPALDCLRELIDKLSRPNRHRLSRAFGYSDYNGTLSRWYHNRSKPTGMNALRLGCVMDYLGFPVVESEKMFDEAKALGGLVGFGLLDLEDVMDRLSLSRTAVEKFIRGETILDDDNAGQRRPPEWATRFVTIRDMFESNPVLRQRLHADLETNLGFLREGKAAACLLGNGSVERAEPREPVIDEGDDSVGPDAGRAVPVLAAMVRAMLPLAELVAGDEFNMEDRERLRELAGKYAVFDLKNALARLCGERARTTLTCEKEG